MSYFPKEPDSWSESLTPTEGVWASGTTGQVNLDYVHKIVGQTSIDHTTPIPDYYGALRFILNTPFDCSKWEKMIFYHALAPNQNHQGFCELMLIDINGYTAFRNFGTQPSGEWEKKEFVVGEGNAEWGFPPFDWSKIVEIQIRWYFFDVNPYTWRGNQDSWIDSLYFYRGLISVTINSEPQGKNMIINGTPGVTPVTWKVSTGTWTIKAEPTGFKQWENGDTNPDRTIDIQTPLTLTAYYEGGSPPPTPPLPSTNIFLVLGGITLLLVVGYTLFKG